MFIVYLSLRYQSFPTKLSTANPPATPPAPAAITAPPPSAPPSTPPVPTLAAPPAPAPPESPAQEPVQEIQVQGIYRLTFVSEFLTTAINWQHL